MEKEHWMSVHAWAALNSPPNLNSQQFVDTQIRFVRCWCCQRLDKWYKYKWNLHNTHHVDDARMVTTVGLYQAIKNNGRWSNRAESLFKVRLIPELSEYYYPQSLIIIDIVVLVNVIIIVAQVINRRRWLRKTNPWVFVSTARGRLACSALLPYNHVQHTAHHCTQKITLCTVHIILHVPEAASISTL